jgi:quercetin dioxygenase-like cupin family protein
MQITRNSLETVRGPADRSTGDVHIDPIADRRGPAGIQAAVVRFTPGSRTIWHTHPRGQTIWVTEGIGFCQREGGPVEVIRPGDRVLFEPDEDHWNGAAPTRFMAHIAIQQADAEGTAVVFGERVRDEQYGQAPEMTEEKESR